MPIIPIPQRLLAAVAVILLATLALSCGAETSNNGTDMPAAVFSNSPGPSFSLPSGVAVAADGAIIVADTFNSRIKRMPATGLTFQSLQVSDAAAITGQIPTRDFNIGGNFLYPEDMAIAPSGVIYIADTLASQIVLLNSDGSRLSTWGSSGSDPGQFSTPQGIAIDQEGNLLVADTGNDRIQKFSPNGLPLLSFGSPGSSSGELLWPEAVAVDNADGILESDSGNHRIQKFDSQGRFILG